MGSAISYALNHWTELTRFLDDASLPIDNNISEGALRVVALGRKNFLHYGHDHAGQNIAMLYSLVSTCEANSINPIEYLQDVLLRLRTHPHSRLDELLPHRWRPVGKDEPEPDPSGPGGDRGAAKTEGDHSTVTGPVDGAEPTPTATNSDTDAMASAETTNFDPSTRIEPPCPELAATHVEGNASSADSFPTASQNRVNELVDVVPAALANGARVVCKAADVRVRKGTESAPIGAQAQRRPQNCGSGRRRSQRRSTLLRARDSPRRSSRTLPAAKVTQ
jgi:hypothetical protein